MDIQQHDMTDAVNAKLISSEQASQLWSFWQTQHKDTPGFNLTHVMYYFGGILAISAVTLFVTQAWEHWRGMPLFICSVILFAIGFLLSRYFIKTNLVIPAGIMSTFSLAVVPLAVYNIQVVLGFFPDQIYQYHGFHDWINWRWMPMEVITLFVGVVMLYLYNFPFLLFPVSICLWYMSMDLFCLLTMVDDYHSRSLFSLFFGILIIAAAIYMDFKYDENKKDYAFWLYIFGVLAFWGGLTSLDSSSELNKFFYCLINIGMILISVILNRRVFAIFGTIGVLGYLGHLSFTIFSDSLGFPVALVLLGILIILLATRWSRIEKSMIELLQGYIPHKILKRMK